jgi:hypothetical protein
MLLIYGVLLNVGGMLLIFSGAFWYCRYQMIRKGGRNAGQDA